MNIPLRYNIVNLLMKSDGMTPKELYDKLYPIYKGEKQCSEEAIDHHLMSMKGVGLVEMKNAEQDSGGNLICTYSITNYGAERARKYIAKYLV